MSCKRDIKSTSVQCQPAFSLRPGRSAVCWQKEGMALPPPVHICFSRLTHARTHNVRTRLHAPAKQGRLTCLWLFWHHRNTPVQWNYWICSGWEFNAAAQLNGTVAAKLPQLTSSSHGGFIVAHGPPVNEPKQETVTRRIPVKAQLVERTTRSTSELQWNLCWWLHFLVWAKLHFNGFSDTFSQTENFVTACNTICVCLCVNWRWNSELAPTWFLDITHITLSLNLDAGATLREAIITV